MIDFTLIGPDEIRRRLNASLNTPKQQLVTSTISEEPEAYVTCEEVDLSTKQQTASPATEPFNFLSKFVTSDNSGRRPGPFCRNKFHFFPF